MVQPCLTEMVTNDPTQLEKYLIYDYYPRQITAETKDLFQGVQNNDCMLKQM